MLNQQVKRSLSAAGAAFAVLLLAGGAAWAQSPPPPLPDLKADANSATLSGISSGGYQAVQAHVAYSGLFRGAAVFAGGPYYCAEGWTTHALGRCMKASTTIPVTKLVDITKQWAAASRIDPVSNLVNDKVYLFQGADDTTVKPPVGAALDQYYRAFINPANMTVVDNVPAEHAWITWKQDQPVNACGFKGSPFVNNCDSDPEKTFLELFYGQMKPKAANLSGRLAAFDQNEFFDNQRAESHSMGSTGYVYIPATCEAARSNCRVHVALHGCHQYYGEIGDAFVKNAGLNEWADTNKIIVLYPQTKDFYTVSSTDGNPNGCWNWWGFGGVSNYAEKSAPQLLALKRMVDRVTGQGPLPPPPPPVQCFTTANYWHVQAGRAHLSGSAAFARANGSNDAMGYYNVWDVTTLKRIGLNYYVVGSCN